MGVHVRKFFGQSLSQCPNHRAQGKAFFSSSILLGNSLSKISESAAGVFDYEFERTNFKLVQPTYFNFAKNVIDKWAFQEKDGTLNNHGALWWVGDDGREIKWTFSDLSKISQRVANVLESPACGLVRGDRVMVILPRIPQWWAINIACIRTGTVMLPGTTMLTPRDVRSRLKRSNAKCLITDLEIGSKLQEILNECPNLKSRILVTETNAATLDGWKNFDTLVEKASDEHKCCQTQSDESMQIFFTSGTTAEPKMAEHTHASYGLGHLITGKYFLDLTANDLIYCIADTGWAKAAYSNIFASWIRGACVFINQQKVYDSKNILQILTKYPISVFCQPPTGYRMSILEKIEDYKFKNLRHCVSAGEALNPEVTAKWFSSTGIVIREGYGQTETVVAVATLRCMANKPGSMGKPVPGMDVQIINENGQEVEPEKEGEIAVKVAPNRPVGLFSRYVDDEEKTHKSFRNGFFMTGDRAFQDTDGYFYFVGRSDDVIKSSGYRISPFEVESALIEHPAVAESAVVASPDTIRGHIVKAFVVLSPTYQSADKNQLINELQNYVKMHTAPYKYPREIEFISSLPKTVSGKIRRVELRQREQEIKSKANS